jgi:hypothetical protein
MLSTFSNHFASFLFTFIPFPYLIFINIRCFLLCFMYPIIYILSFVPYVIFFIFNFSLLSLSLSLSLSIYIYIYIYIYISLMASVFCLFIYLVLFLLLSFLHSLFLFCLFRSYFFVDSIHLYSFLSVRYIFFRSVSVFYFILKWHSLRFYSHWSWYTFISHTSIMPTKIINYLSIPHCM